jgi:pimeloyl-ACP methyl ester carboxylesterase
MAPNGAMRALLFILVLLLEGCAFSQLREDLSEFYADPEALTGQVFARGAAHVAHIDAPGFTVDYGRMGLWQPVSFVKEKRGGVYFLEPYDAAKIPVLLVHGAGGTPQDWRYFIERLDRSRYQVWAYYYPTGLPMDVSAAWLNSIVRALHARYGFQQLYVAGHSMGGLVARRFIALNSQSYVKLLVTFVTPWDGVPFARLGASLGVYAIPSWRDLVPGSAFLRAVQSEKLPAGVQHHLFFGYREEGDAFDSDGVITVSSQRERHIERAATQVHGFRTDHSAILDDAAVFRRFAGLLAGFN